MRPDTLPRTLALLIALGAGTAAQAQVSLDPRALEGLQDTPAALPSAPAPSPSTPAPATADAPTRPAGSSAARSRPGHPMTRAAPHASARAAHAGAGIPVPSRAPPAPPALPPPTPVPVRVEKPPPMPAISDGAPGRATPIPNGARLTFGPGLATLNPATAAAIHRFARQARADPALTVAIDAYAEGSAEDPSLARRLSLSRGLAVRALLMGDGIESPRIMVRALGRPADLAADPAAGPAAPGIPADRADLRALPQSGR